MSFNDFTNEDWEFLQAAVHAGADCPEIDEEVMDEVLSMVERKFRASHFSDEEMEALREAFAIGWNVATENGTNELAEKFSAVKFAVESKRPGAFMLMPGVH